MYLSEPFDTMRGFRQGDPLSWDLFYFVMENVLRKAGVHRNRTIFHKSVQLLAYADGIAIIGQTKRDVTVAFSVIEREPIIDLSSALTTKNDVSLEFKRKITLGNRCYYGLKSQLTKLILYKTLILSVLLCSTEVWTPLSTNAAALRVFERKVLRKIFGPVGVGDDFRIWSNNELHKLLSDIDVVQRSCCLGHVVRMEDNLVCVGRTKSIGVTN